MLARAFRTLRIANGSRCRASKLSFEFLGTCQNTAMQNATVPPFRSAMDMTLGMRKQVGSNAEVWVVLILVGSLLSSIAIPMIENRDSRSVLQQAKRIQERYEHCEIAYFTEIVSNNVEPPEKERFTGGFSAYESWHTSNRFLLATNAPLRRNDVTDVLRQETKPHLDAYRFVTLSNERYQARVEKTRADCYILRGMFSPGQFEVLPQHSVRYLFAPNFDDWSSPEKVHFEPEATFAGESCCSIELERRIPEDHPPSWERRTVYLDLDLSRCLGHQVVYSDTPSFESPSAIEEHIVEYDAENMPKRMVRTRTGNFEFTQIYELVSVKVQPQASERFFLPHYGFEEWKPQTTRSTLGLVLIALVLLLLGIGAVAQRLAKPNRT